VRTLIHHFYNRSEPSAIAGVCGIEQYIHIISNRVEQDDGNDGDVNIGGAETKEENITTVSNTWYKF
jgi:hypothetical protein